MAKDIHTIALLSGSLPARQDRLILGLLPQQAYLAGKGAIASIGNGTPGAGYSAIPTVAINPPASGAGATGSGATATAVMKVISATVAAGGSGGTSGTQTVTGTTGTGTKFQASVTIAGGAITAVLSISVVGAYTVMPTLAGEPVTGASLSGATLNIVMGVASYTIGAGGTLYPSAGVTIALSGGTPTTAAVPGAVVVTSAAGNGSAFDVAGLRLPATYSVIPSLDQDCTVYITNRTQTGFRVNVAPRLAASTLAAGTLDLLIAA
jgi:hypothetical protein